MNCWMFKSQPPAYILGGRFGDITSLLGCFHAIYQRTGHRPIVITSTDYCQIYDGVSYVKPHPIRMGWWECVPTAKQIAEELYGGGTVLQFWQMPPQHDDTIGFGGRNWATLQSHGRMHGVNMALDPDYGTSMARRCGFSRDEWRSLPVIFDRRSPERETELASRYRSHKPMLLVGLTGVSSPFPYTPEVWSKLGQFAKDFSIVDIGKIRCHRPYDLLTLMDHAAGLITSDTFTAHLSVASEIPTVWCTVDGWTASVPRGKCQLEVKYSQVKQRLDQIMSVVASWRTHHAPVTA